eukprot:130217-Pelagomonas_calceolata.AAC.1
MVLLLPWQRAWPLLAQACPVDAAWCGLLWCKTRGAASRERAAVGGAAVQGLLQREGACWGTLLTTHISHCPKNN